MPEEGLETPREPAHSKGTIDFSTVLDELVDIVEKAKSMPLSASAIISRDEVLELLEAARDALPGELARARRVVSDREAILERTEREAAELVGEARAQAAHMVERTEIVRQARNAADRIVAEADADARRTRHEADDYVDRKLASFEIVLDRTIRTVQAGRERLTVVPEDPEVSRRSDNSEDGSEENLFDQDLA